MVHPQFQSEHACPNLLHWLSKLAALAVRTGNSQACELDKRKYRRENLNERRRAIRPGTPPEHCGRAKFAGPIRRSDHLTDSLVLSWVGVPVVAQGNSHHACPTRCTLRRRQSDFGMKGIAQCVMIGEIASKDDIHKIKEKCQILNDSALERVCRRVPVVLTVNLHS